MVILRSERFFSEPKLALLGYKNVIKFWLFGSLIVVTLIVCSISDGCI